MSFEYKVADLSLAEFGRKEIELAEHEMPGLMSTRARVRSSPSRFAVQESRAASHDRPDGRAHRDPRRARGRGALGLVQHLFDPGPRRGRSRRRPGRLAVRAPGRAGLRLEGRDPRAVLGLHREDAPLAWWDRTEHDPRRRWGRHLVSAQGGRVREGRRRAGPGGADNEELAVILSVLKRSLEEDPRRWSEIANHIRGVTEETTTGVHRLYQMQERGELLFPAINVNDSVTKSKFDNKYGCRHSLIDGINRATDVLIGGKVALVCGYGDVGKGCAESLSGQGARVVVDGDRPDLRSSGRHGRLPVATVEDVVATADIFVSATGNRSVITAEHMSRMKHQAIVGNIGHFDNEIDMAGLSKLPGVPGEHQAPGRQVGLPRRPRRHHPCGGAPLEPGLRDRPPELRDVELVHESDHGPDRAVHQARRL